MTDNNEKEPDEQKLSPMVVAMQWTSRITTISLEMVLPGIGGNWLDERWGTNYLAPLGFVFGVTLGMWHLIRMTNALNLKKKTSDKKESEPDKP